MLVTRRFKGPAPNTESTLTRAVELGISPSPGMVLAFPDGAEVVISQVRYRVLATTGYGVQPAEVELLGCRESFTRWDAAVAAGWTAGLRADDSAGIPPRKGSE